MLKFETVEAYLQFHQENHELLLFLRELILESELKETIKWGAPCYTFHGKNVLGLASFKSYVGLWFHQGVLLKDKENVLINAQEGTTKALRQWRFKDSSQFNPVLVKSYIEEAIGNERQGVRIKASPPKELILPVDLLDTFKKDPQLESQFAQFTPYKKREFAEFIAQAKRKSTRKNRLNKIIPLIRSGIGLNDKYRK